jgi:cytochrome c oxidase subunit 2
MFLIQAAGAASHVDHPQTTFEPVTAYGDTLNHLFANTFMWTMLILAIVIIMTLAIAIRFREKPGDARPKAVHGHTGLEIGWTLIPTIIIILITIPTVRTVIETQAKPPADALTIEVIGHQWWWEFRYPEQGVVTANELWVPTGRPIHLSMYSQDVIHSFWIPRFGGKRDVNPVPKSVEGERDKRNHIQFTVRDTGYFSGQCAEFCGDSHALMRVSARAVSPEHFASWAAQMKAGGPQVAPTQPNATAVAEAANTSATRPVAQVVTEPVQAGTPKINFDMPVPTGVGNPVHAEIPDSIWAAEGKRVFTTKTCIVCHSISGTTAAGVIGPNLTNFGSRPTVGAGVAPNTLENLQKWIHDPHAMKPGALMPGVTHETRLGAPTGLTDLEVYAIARYLLSLKLK